VPAGQWQRSLRASVAGFDVAVQLGPARGNVRLHPRHIQGPPARRYGAHGLALRAQQALLPLQLWWPLHAVSMRCAQCPAPCRSPACLPARPPRQVGLGGQGQRDLVLQLQAAGKLDTQL
jgi:hypothetical protein